MSPVVLPLVIALAVAAPAAGQTPVSAGAPTPAAAAAPDMGAQLEGARRSMDAGRFDEAMKALAGLDRHDPRVGLLAGLVLYHQDKLGEAVAALRPAVAALPAGTPSRREAEQALGTALHLTGRFAEAVPHLEAVHRAAPQDQALAFTLAQAYIQTQQAAPARGVLAAAFGLKPDAAAAGVIAAQLMIRLEQHALAERELQWALKQDARTPRANFLLGQLALFRGDLEAAATYTTREMALSPTDAMALQQLGDVRARQERWAEAIPILERSLWLNPFYSGTYILLGRGYTATKQHGLAEQMLRRAIEYDPNNPTAHYALGQVLRQRGRTDEAEKAFATAERLRELRR